MMLVPDTNKKLKNLPSIPNTKTDGAEERARASATESLAVKDLEFTREMIKDQEALITALKQQGIPDNLIDRQFNRLLDEQKKQLLSYLEPPEQRQSRGYVGLHVRESDGSVSRRKRAPSETHPHVQPGGPRPRSNGLQEPATVKGRRREAERPARQRLDGTQDRSDAPAHRGSDATPDPVCLANGLQEEEPAVEMPRREELAPEPQACPAEIASVRRTDAPSQELRCFGGLTYLARRMSFEK